jgi:hypothetical protein
MPRAWGLTRGGSTQRGVSDMAVLTARPPAQSWWVQKLSADCPADCKSKRLKAGGLPPRAKRPSGGHKPPSGQSRFGLGAGGGGPLNCRACYARRRRDGVASSGPAKRRRKTQRASGDGRWSPHGEKVVGDDGPNATGSRQPIEARGRNAPGKHHRYEGVPAPAHGVVP